MSELLTNRFDGKFTDKKIKKEKIDGKIYLMARPTKRHMRIQGNIYKIFSNYFTRNGRKCEALFEIRVDFENGDYLEPDVSVFCYENGREDQEEVPPIVVEVLSKSSRKRDLVPEFISAIFPDLIVKAEEYFIR